eukprot:CAMPEP_0179003090 /NCGR_PEP_ID=MMETSP0795-20121207/12445_1 /TAXON_ID=88552 /ORGANISM="Amoebophrya sp., Strain Ameob2" /LENGTH=600 /DNA_ID=CAMNT_0020696981 /DNA_START=440 /DNA_END=2242 /DNA_ORIENTATION=+
MACQCGNCGAEMSDSPQWLRPLRIPDLPDADDEDSDPQRALQTITRELAELAAKNEGVKSPRYAQVDDLKACSYRLVESPPVAPSKRIHKNLVPSSQAGGSPDDKGPWLVSFYVTIPGGEQGGRSSSAADLPTDVDDACTEVTSDHQKASKGGSGSLFEAIGNRLTGAPPKKLLRKKPSPFAGDRFVLDFRFNSTYPELPPCVGFRSTIHHPFLQNEGQQMPMLYYQSVKTEPPPGLLSAVAATGAGSSARVFTLPAMLDAVISFCEDGCGQDQQFFSLMDAYPEHESSKKNLQKYVPFQKCPEFFSLRAGDDIPDAWLDERFLRWRNAGYSMSTCSKKAFWDQTNRKPGDSEPPFLIEHRPDIYSFPLFKPEFCDMLVKEIRSIYDSKIEVQRPNSMNRYGVILNYIGMEGMMSAIQRLMQKTNLAEKKFGGVGSSWDGHHSFIVQYAPGKDLGLDMHTDDSDVTCNICLGIDFTGSQVAFCGKMGHADHRKENYVYDQVKGHCLIHLGRQRHGAVDIEKGERMNLIIWNRSRVYRDSDEYKEQRFVKEMGPPSEICLSYTHDRDYGVYKRYPKGFEKFKGRGWCPPRSAEYEGFVPEN